MGSYEPLQDSSSLDTFCKLKNRKSKELAVSSVFKFEAFIYLANFNLYIYLKNPCY